MRIPHSRADESLRMVLRKRMSTYTVERITGESSQSAMGEAVQNTTTVSIDAYLYFPEEENLPIDFGERLEGSLQGLALPSADVQVNDVFTHGSEQFQVEDVSSTPSSDDVTLQRFTLTKMTNPP